MVRESWGWELVAGTPHWTVAGGHYAVNRGHLFLAGALLGNHAWLPCSPGQDEAVGANIF